MKATLHFNMSSFPEVCSYATRRIQLKFNVLLFFMYHVLLLFLHFYEVLLNMLPLHWYFRVYCLYSQSIFNFLFYLLSHVDDVTDVCRSTRVLFSHFH